MDFSFKSLKKIGRILNPKVEVGGLEISDSGAVFMLIIPETKKISSTSIKFSNGVVVGGKVQNRSDFVNALKRLHSSITSVKNNKIPVVVSISDTSIYTQQFVLPNLKLATLEEAVRLNLQVISPIDFTSAYSDWQKVEVTDGSARETEILASFVEKSAIDRIYSALLESQFIAVAVEQRAASLTRVVSWLSNSYNSKDSYFLLYVSSDGLGFAIIRYGYLYFNRFTPWSALAHYSSGQKQISFKEFSETIIQESQRVINFYSSHFNSVINSIYIIAPNLEQQVKQIVESNFPFKVEPLILKDYQVDQSWLVALGAALRGIVPRSIDTEISLAPEGTETQFFRSRVLVFTVLWRNVLAAVFTIILLSTVGVYLFLGNFINRLAEDFSNVAGNYNIAYLNALKNEAINFNKSATAALTAKSQQTKWSQALLGITNQAVSGVSVDRIYVQSLDLPVVLNGRAPTSNAALDFKNKLAVLPYINGINLPLSSLVPTGISEVSFTISFKIIQSNI